MSHENPSPGRNKIRRIREHYVSRFRQGRPHHEILDWAGLESQHRRFEVLARNVELEGRRLLDVGCGLGDLVCFLETHGIEVDYTGVDVLEEMLDHARRAHPSRRFVHANLFNENPFPPGSFDVVFSSGAFNLNLGNNVEFLRDGLPRLLSLARHKLVVNLLHARQMTRDSTYFCYHPEEIAGILRPLCAEVRVLDDYLENDFTLIAAPAQPGGTS